MTRPPLETAAMLAMTVLIWAVAIFAVGSVAAIFISTFNRWRKDRKSGVMLTFDEYREFCAWKDNR
jgi:hypothetical protein